MMLLTRITTAVLLTLGLAAQAPAATNADLEARLTALAAQVQSLQAEVAQLKAQNGAASAAPATGPTVAAAPALPGTPAADTRLDWFGYGEISYSRPDEIGRAHV